MAYEALGQRLGTLVAGEDLSSSQFYAVKLNTSGAVVLAGAGDAAIGILQNDPALGESCNIHLSEAGGVSKGALGGSVSPGDALTSDANGKIVAGTDLTSNFGVALESGSSGELGTVLLQQSGTLARGATTLTLPIPAMSGVADGDLITNIQPGFAGRIIALEFVCTTAITTAAKATTINAEIGTTNCTGSLEIAGTYAIGAGERVAVTANNTFDEHDIISLEASSTTTFTEGVGFILVHIDRVPAAAGGFAVMSIQLPSMAAIANGDIATGLTMPFAGRAYAMEFVATTAVTTAAKTTTLNLEIGTTNMGGSLTVAGTYAVGAAERANLTTPNTFAAGDTISLEAASTTTFIEGAGVLYIYIDNIPYATTMDSSILAVPIDLTAIADGDLVTDITLGYPGRIVAMELLGTKTCTPGAGTTIFSMEINAVNCTGSLTAVDDGYGTVGGVQRALVTANNTFVATDTISVELASTTVWPAGAQGVLLVYIDKVRSE
jgi:hypothetical protein